MKPLYCQSTTDAKNQTPRTAETENPRFFHIGMAGQHVAALPGVEQGIPHLAGQALMYGINQIVAAHLQAAFRHQQQDEQEENRGENPDENRLHPLGPVLGKGLGVSVPVVALAEIFHGPLEIPLLQQRLAQPDIGQGEPAVLSDDLPPKRLRLCVMPLAEQTAAASTSRP